MKVIYKYPLGVTDRQIINLPTDTEILCVQIQAGTPCVWALVDPDASTVPFHFETYGTGHQVTENERVEKKYLGTFQMLNGTLVYHVFYFRGTL